MLHANWRYSVHWVHMEGANHQYLRRSSKSGENRCRLVQTYASRMQYQMEVCQQVNLQPLSAALRTRRETRRLSDGTGCVHINPTGAM